jgi:serine/threonine protein kinase
MKKIDLSKIKNDEEKKLCLAQMEKLKSLIHPHLIRYYKTFKDDKECLYLIYEYMNNADIQSFIKAHQVLEKKIKEEEIWNILLQCLSALEYLHKENLAHLAIKYTNIYLNNEQNVKVGLFRETPKLEDKDYNIKDDIMEIGLYFYKMCYSQFPETIFKIVRGEKKYTENNHDFPVKKEPNNYYSSELLNIVLKMIEEDPNKRLSSGELYNIVKDEYVKKFTNNTSIKSVLRCLYSYPIFSQQIMNEEQNITQNKDKYYINYWYLSTIKAFVTNQDSNKCLEEFRRALASENTKLDCSKEVDPIYLLAFLLEKMHREYNKVVQTEVKGVDYRQQYVINSRYKVEEEDRTNKEQMIQKFNSYFNKNINSIISKLFFGVMKTKRICRVCKSPAYSFSNNCFLAFDVNKCLEPAFDIIKHGFLAQHKENRILRKDKYHVFCDKCLTEQNHNEFNRFYSFGEHLVICFFRGNNYSKNTPINVVENLTLKKGKYPEDENSPFNYYLVGSVNRVTTKVNNEEKEVFHYFSRDPFNRTVWHCSLDNKVENLPQAPVQAIQQTGQVIVLFYNAIKNPS